MNQEQLYELINNIPVTPENAGLIEEIKMDLTRKDYTAALRKNRKVEHKKGKKYAKRRNRRR